MLVQRRKTRSRGKDSLIWSPPFFDKILHPFKSNQCQTDLTFDSRISCLMVIDVLKDMLCLVTPRGWNLELLGRPLFLSFSFSTVWQSWGNPGYAWSELPCFPSLKFKMRVKLKYYWTDILISFKKWSVTMKSFETILVKIQWKFSAINWNGDQQRWQQNILKFMYCLPQERKIGPHKAPHNF